jgi:hypothetical protein
MKCDVQKEGIGHKTEHLVRNNSLEVLPLLYTSLGGQVETKYPKFLSLAGILRMSRKHLNS